jgi:hypothetical protein
LCYINYVKETLAVIAALLAVAGNLPYLWDILKERVRPHPYTWLVWSIVSGIVLFGQIAKGAGIGALPTAASEIFTILIFLFSLKYGFKGITKTDTVFLFCALFGIALWIYTNDPTYSVIIAVTIDVIAFVPTLRKTWADPATETPILYSSNVLRHILALFSLQTYNIATTLHSIAMIGTNTLMTAIILFHKKKKNPVL